MARHLDRGLAGVPHPGSCPTDEHAGRPERNGAPSFLHLRTVRDNRGGGYACCLRGSMQRQSRAFERRSDGPQGPFGVARATTRGTRAVLEDTTRWGVVGETAPRSRSLAAVSGIENGEITVFGVGVRAATRVRRQS